jgi:hypothetical protein
MSRGTKTVLRWLLACGAVVALLYAGWWSLCEWYLFASIGYEVETEFAELPPDDVALEAWLKQQPGVAVVGVSRAESRKAVRINLIMSQNLHYRPRFPDVEKACEELGYRGQIAPFRDTERRRAK